MLKPSKNEICPSCMEPGIVIGWSGGEDIYLCRKCGLRFLGESARARSAEYNNWYEDILDLDQSSVDSFFCDMEGPYNRQISFLEKITPGRNILDFGCGPGIFLATAKKRGWAINGVEASRHGILFAKKKLGIELTSDITNYKEETFDVIRLSHVLEHIPYPRGLLLDLRRLLKHKGILVITVPNREPLCEMMINTFRGMFSKKPKLMGDPYPYMHVLGFSVESLSNLIMPLGYKAISIGTVSMGNQTYYPLFYDGILRKRTLSHFILKESFKYWAPLFVNIFGSVVGKGSWVVAYYRKETVFQNFGKIT